MSCDEIGNDPKRLRATVSQGDDWVFRMLLKQSGAIVNLTGWSCEAIAKKAGQSDVPLTVDIAAALGQITATLSRTQTANMVAGRNSDDLASRWTINIRIIDSAGLARRYLTIELILIK